MTNNAKGEVFLRETRKEHREGTPRLYILQKVAQNLMVILDKARGAYIRQQQHRCWRWKIILVTMTKIVWEKAKVANPVLYQEHYMEKQVKVGNGKKENIIGLNSLRNRYSHSTISSVLTILQRIKITLMYISTIRWRYWKKIDCIIDIKKLNK